MAAFALILVPHNVLMIVTLDVKTHAVTIVVQGAVNTIVVRHVLEAAKVHAMGYAKAHVREIVRNDAQPDVAIHAI